MVAAEPSVSPITVASKVLLLPMSPAWTNQKRNCLRPSNFCAIRSALGGSAGERRAAFFFMDHREPARLCSRGRPRARRAVRFFQYRDRGFRGNLRGSARPLCRGLSLALPSFYLASFSLTGLFLLG